MSKLIVHHLPGAWGLPSISPFCLKLDTYLRMMDIPFEVVVDATPFGAPKKKLPYIEHNGSVIGDSSFIIEYLKQAFACDANSGLSAQEKAVAHALQRLLEDSLYWTLVYDRWMVDSNWQWFQGIVLGGMPAPVRLLLAPTIRRGVRKQLRGQGIGVHSAQEIHQIGCRDMAAGADWLGDKPFLMGEAPTDIDAVAYGILANLLLAPTVTPIKDAGLARDNLVAYLQRMQGLYFPAE